MILPLTAYRLHDRAPRIVPAAPKREWCDETGDKFAYRCLPLTIASSLGWWVLLDRPVTAKWRGGKGIDDLVVTECGGVAASHFGSGVLTFSLPFVFRTPPGWSLLIRGPSNWPKPNAAPLEGLVESDTTHASATMNWKMTGPCATWDAGEPFAQLLPVRRDDLSLWSPRVAPIAEDQSLADRHAAWSLSRAKFIADLRRGAREAVDLGWQRDYTRAATMTSLKMQAPDTGGSP